MLKYALVAEKRDGAGKGVARALRRASRVPAVIYGDKKEPVLISLDMNTINVQYNRGHMYHSLCEMDVAGESHVLLARDVQLHPVTDVVEHVDFLRVTPATKIPVYVPVHFINQDKSPGIFEKGNLNVVRFEVELMCPATDIPAELVVNLEGKRIGDAIKVSDAVMPAGITPVIRDRDFTIATIEAPKVIAADAAPAA